MSPEPKFAVDTPQTRPFAANVDGLAKLGRDSGAEYRVRIPAERPTVTLPDQILIQGVGGGIA
jgi:hypothetical protein